MEFYENKPRSLVPAVTPIQALIIKHTSVDFSQSDDVNAYGT